MKLFISLNYKVTYCRRDKYISIKVEKLENRDVQSKVQGEDGISLEEQSDNFCDISKDANDENHLQPAPARKDEEERSQTIFSCLKAHIVTRT